MKRELTRGCTQFVDTYKASRIFAVYGKQSAAALHVPEALAQLTATVATFSGIPAGSPTSSVASCAAAMRDFQPDAVIAIGGGSPIDVAKSARAVYDESMSAEDIDYLWRQYNVSLPMSSIPLLAIPTTAGTGTEVTPYTALTDCHGRRLFGYSDVLCPDHSLLIPSLLRTVPLKVASEVAMDAFTHALEAYWSTRATPASDAYALKALGRMHRSLLRYCEDPSDAIASDDMLTAAHLAGKAFAIASSTACHGLSFPLEDRIGGSHGGACAHLIEAIARDAVADGPTRKKLAALIPELGIDNPDTLPTYISELRSTLSSKLSEVSRETIHDSAEEIIQGACTPMMKNNPVRYTEQELVSLLRSL